MPTEHSASPSQARPPWCPPLCLCISLGETMQRLSLCVCLIHSARGPCLTDSPVWLLSLTHAHPPLTPGPPLVWTLKNPRSLEHLRAVLTLTVRPTFLSLSSSLWAGCSHLLLLPSAWSSALGTTTTHDPPVFCRGPCLAFLPPTGEPGAEVCGPQEVRQVGTGVLPGVLP